MHNIAMKVEGGELVIRMKIGKRDVDAAPLSKEGKSRLVASTSGFTMVPVNGAAAPDGMKIAVNLILPRS